MSDKLQQAAELVNKQKFKKALQLLKKINHKTHMQTYQSLELEGVCLINEKKYQLAEIVLAKTLLLAKSTEQKINTLSNMITTANHRQDTAKIIEKYQQILAIEPSVKTAQYRLQLCQFAFLNKQYHLVIEYADKLFGISQYSHLALMMSFGAFTLTEQYSRAMSLYSKLMLN